MSVPITRVILYVKNIPKVADFYQRNFGMTPLPSQEKGWLEMTSARTGRLYRNHLECDLRIAGLSKTQAGNEQGNDCREFHRLRLLKAS